MTAAVRSADPKPVRTASNHGVLLLGVWIVATAYLALHVDRGWVPHDDGVLAQSAERVLHGELPHRDFNDPYTGGLSFLHAFAFALFGAKLIVLRWVLFVVAAATIPAFFYVASRFVSPLAAGGVVLLATVWGVPNYPAAVPSWYNLFLAVGGVAALLRHLETDRRRWLIAAGAAGGLSLLAKIAGLYYLAGAFLFLAYREQCLPNAGGPSSGRPVVFRLALAVAAMIFVPLLMGVVAARPGIVEFTHFVLPPVAVVVLLLWNEERARRVPSLARFRALGRLVLPFVLGATVAVAPLVLVFVRAGALSDLLAGVFAQPLSRLTNAARRPASLAACLFAGLPLVLVLLRSCRPGAWGRLEKTAIAGTLGCGLIAAATDAVAYRFVWYSVLALVPVTILAGAAIMSHPRLRSRLSPVRLQQLFLLLSATAMVALVQFPFSATVYFCYVAPLLVLVIVAILASMGGVRSFAAVSSGAFYLLFAGLLVNRTSVAQGLQFPPERVARLALPRGGIRVPTGQNETYARLITEIQSRATGDDYIYATPDAPEVYFLAGKRNPTRSLFEFLDSEPVDPPSVLQLLARHEVHVVVINHAAQFSELDAGLGAALAARYPDSALVAPFVIRWRS